MREAPVGHGGGRVTTQPRTGFVQSGEPLASDRPRSRVERCGSGKVRHPSEARALEALVRVRGQRIASGDPAMPENRIYVCDRCDGWHLTSRELHPEDLTPERDRHPSEGWEGYAKRLEKRIASQRAEIMSLHTLGHGAGNRESRKRISSLVIALGRMTERWEIERRHREHLVQLLAQDCRCLWCRWRNRSPEPVRSEATLSTKGTRP
jgi:hypothetical protein